MAEHDEEKQTPVSEPQQGVPPVTDPTAVPPQTNVLPTPPVTASANPTPEAKAERAATGAPFADGSVPPNLLLTQQQRAEKVALDAAFAKSQAALASGKARLSDEDKAFVDPSTPEGERNLRRASDPDRALDRVTVDEARTMDLGERTKQLPGAVDRSGSPGADVKTTSETGDETNWSMKSVRADDPKQLTKSMGKATSEIEALSLLRQRGQSSPEFIADLKNIKDPAQIGQVEAQLQATLAAQNQKIADSSSGQNPIQMRSVLPEAVIEARRQAEAQAQAQAKGGS